MAKSYFKGIGLALLGIITLYFLLGVAGVFDLAWYKTFGKAQANIQHEIFKEGQTYNEGMVRTLATYQQQYLTEKDPVAKQAIVTLINQQYANFDATRIENVSLRAFLIDVQSGKLTNTLNLGGTSK